MLRCYVGCHSVYSDCSVMCCLYTFVGHVISVGNGGSSACNKYISLRPMHIEAYKCSYNSTSL
jgi:hypothetical protein